MSLLLSLRLVLTSLTVVICAPRAVAASVEVLPAELHGAIQPQVSVSPAGRIHVTFGKGDAIYHVASADRGRTFSKPVQIGELTKLAIGMRRGPRITATDKVVAITAISHAEGDLHSWSSRDGGATWKASANVNDTPTSAREGLHAMAGDDKGNVFVTWLDLRNKGTELWGASSHDGGVSWGANTLVYKSPDGHICECCHPSAAMDAEGRVAVMWRNWLGGARDMYAAMSDDGGKTFAAAHKLGTGTWKLSGCPMDGGAIALGRDGKALTSWRREKTAFACESENAEEQLADSAFQPIVVGGTGASYYLWESGGGLILKKAASNPVRFADNATFAAGAPLPDRGAVVVWESQEGGGKTIRAQVLE